MSRARGKSRRATLTAIADKAEVSLSTVDRVLNARHPVSEKRARRVLDAARELGYHATNLIERRIDEIASPLRMGVVIHDLSRPFYRDLAIELRATAPAMGCSDLIVEELVDLTPSKMADRIKAVATRVDAIGAVAFDHPLVNECIEDLAREGKSVVAVLTHLASPGIAGYVGIDNVKAGRTAGWCLARLCGGRGKVAVVAGSYQFRGQHERMIGLNNFFMEHEPDMQVAETIYVLDSGAIAEQLFQELLDRHPGIDGVYAIGGGVSGIVRVLESKARDAGLSVVCHELTDPVKSAIRDGLIDFVIETPLAELAEKLLSALRERCLTPAAPSRITNVEFRLHCPESC